MKVKASLPYLLLSIKVTIALYAMPTVSEGTGQTEREEMRQRELGTGKSGVAPERSGRGV